MRKILIMLLIGFVPSIITAQQCEYSHSLEDKNTGQISRKINLSQKKEHTVGISRDGDKYLLNIKLAYSNEKKETIKKGFVFQINLNNGATQEFILEENVEPVIDKHQVNSGKTSVSLTYTTYDLQFKVDKATLEQIAAHAFSDYYFQYLNGRVDEFKLKKKDITKTAEAAACILK